jgi:hypothetical protein
MRWSRRFDPSINRGFATSISLSIVIALSSAWITGSLTRSVIGDRPSHPIYRVERTSSRMGLAPTVDQRLFTAHEMGTPHETEIYVR